MEHVRVSKEKGEFDYRTIQNDLLNLLEATANKLEREWDIRYANVGSACVVFYQYIRVAINTFNTMMFISADLPKDPNRKSILCLSLPPLSRTLFEQLIAIMFLVEDISTYIPYLFKTGYTERRIHLDHSLKYHENDPAWQSYIDAQRKQIVKEEQEYLLTQDEIDSPRKKIGRWLTPGAMLKKLRQDHPSSSAIPYIEYMNSWLYRELSGHTHLNLSGLIHRGIAFDTDTAKLAYGEEWKEKVEEWVQNYRINQAFLAITLVLAIVSEIEIHFNYGLNQRCRYLWVVLNEASDISKDLWDRRYSSHLPK